MALILSGIAVAGARAQDHSPPQTESIDPDVARLIQVLLGEDWKASETAAQALSRRGVAGARAVLAQRARTRGARERERLEHVLRDVVNTLVVDLQRPLIAEAQRFSAQAALGDAIGAIDPSGEASVSSEQSTDAEIEAAGALGREEPKSGIETKIRARAARSGLAALGPAAIGLALDVPPVRPPAATYLLGLLARDVYERDARRILAREKGLRESWHGKADLGKDFVLSGTRDTREAVRAFYQNVRDDAVELALSALDSRDADRRECSQDELFRLSDLAKTRLDFIAKGDDPKLRSAEARVAAERISHRVQFHLSRSLIRRLGHELEGYSDLPFDKRRSLAFELERLGGQEAVPALRRLLVEEKTTEVQAVAAVGLFKQGDMVGAEWLASHNKSVNRISKRDLAALILEEGNNYLKIKKYEQAEKDYLQALELEPKNEVGLYNLACCYSLWGKLEPALTYLKKAIEAGFDDLTHMNNDTDLDPLREDPRFKQMMDALRAKKAKQE